MNNLELYPRQQHGLYFFVQFSKKLANERLLFAEYLNEQLQESREEVKTLRASEKALQQELLMQARAEPKGGRGTK
ncbi:hypothetical protein ACUCKN_003815 [Salmonella enterica subsp. enterica serovar Bareilly]|nr:hypothetical protein [Salmonella enterica]